MGKILKDDQRELDALNAQLADDSDLNEIAELNAQVSGGSDQDEIDALNAQLAGDPDQREIAELNAQMSGGSDQDELAELNAELGIVEEGKKENLGFWEREALNREARDGSKTGVGGAILDMVDVFGIGERNEQRKEYVETRLAMGEEDNPLQMVKLAQSIGIDQAKIDEIMARADSGERSAAGFAINPDVEVMKQGFAELAKPLMVARIKTREAAQQKLANAEEQSIAGKVVSGGLNMAKTVAAYSNPLTMGMATGGNIVGRIGRMGADTYTLDENGNPVKVAEGDRSELAAVKAIAGGVAEQQIWASPLAGIVLKGAGKAIAKIPGVKKLAAGAAKGTLEAVDALAAKLSESEGGRLLLKTGEVLGKVDEKLHFGSLPNMIAKSRLTEFCDEVVGLGVGEGEDPGFRERFGEWLGKVTSVENNVDMLIGMIGVHFAMAGASALKARGEIKKFRGGREEVIAEYIGKDAVKRLSNEDLDMMYRLVTSDGLTVERVGEFLDKIKADKDAAKERMEAGESLEDVVAAWREGRLDTKGLENAGKLLEGELERRAELTPEMEEALDAKVAEHSEGQEPIARKIKEDILARLKDNRVFDEGNEGMLDEMVAMSARRFDPESRRIKAHDLRGGGTSVAEKIGGIEELGVTSWQEAEDAGLTEKDRYGRYGGGARQALNIAIHGTEALKTAVKNGEVSGDLAEELLTAARCELGARPPEERSALIDGILERAKGDEAVARRMIDLLAEESSAIRPENLAERLDEARDTAKAESIRERNPGLSEEDARSTASEPVETADGKMTTLGEVAKGEPKDLAQDMIKPASSYRAVDEKTIERTIAKLAKYYDIDEDALYMADIGVIDKVTKLPDMPVPQFVQKVEKMLGSALRRVDDKKQIKNLAWNVALHELQKREAAGEKSQKAWNVKEIVERDKTDGTNLSGVTELVSAMMAKDEQTVARLRGKHFSFAKTSDVLKESGLNGDYFTIKAGVVLRHNGKDAAHTITPEEWVGISRALSEEKPLLVEKRGNDGKSFRIWTRATIGGKIAIVGADVKSTGRNIDVNSIKTAFGAEGATPNIANIVYPKSQEELQSVLIRHDSGRYTVALPTVGSIPNNLPRVNGRAPQSALEGVENAERLKGTKLKAGEDGIMGCAAFPEVRVEVSAEGITAEGLTAEMMAKPENAADAAALLAQMARIAQKNGIKVRFSDEAAHTTAKALMAEVREQGLAKAQAKLDTRAKLFDLLMKTTLGNGVTYDEKSFAEALGKTSNGAKFRDSHGNIYGFVDGEGVLHFNPAAINFNTPIHEYGHLALEAMKKLDNGLWKRGMELVRKSKYFEEIKKYSETEGHEYGYLKGSDEGICDEALATLIGDRGERLVLDKGVGAELKAWLKAFWRKFKGTFGLADFTDEQMERMTVEEFVDAVNAELLRGSEFGVRRRKSGLSRSDAAKLRERKREDQHYADEAEREAAEARERFEQSGMEALDYVRSRIDEGEPGFDLDWETMREIAREAEQGKFAVGGIYTGTAADYANRSRQGGVDDGPSLKKIGTGEGTQVYGYGLYGSTLKNDAEYYAAKAQANYIPGRGDGRQRIYEQTFFTNRPEGDESHLLSWYGPVTKENRKRVDDALMSVSGNPMDWTGVETGQDLYRKLSNFASPQEASEFLVHYADIDGVKYPAEDHHGRAIGNAKGWNYVSFRDDNIRVDHKWTDGVAKFAARPAMSALAKAKVGDSVEGVSEDGLRNEVERRIEAGLPEKEYRFKKPDDRKRLVADAVKFYKRFSQKTVMLSDGRCVYFVPDARAKNERGLSNEEAWAEYAIHAVTSSGERLEGKDYNERLYNRTKAANIWRIENILKAERCEAKIDDDPRRDGIIFFGRGVDGRTLQVITRLDERGNVYADLSEVTVLTGGKNKKLPPRKPLAEVVGAVANRQLRGGLLTANGDIIPKSLPPRKPPAEVVGAVRKGGDLLTDDASSIPNSGAGAQGGKRAFNGVTPEEDAAYAEAVKRGDMETVRRMEREVYRRMGYSDDSGYQGTSAFNGAAPSRNAYFETKAERIEATKNGEMEDTTTLGDFRDGIDLNNLQFIVFDPRSERNADAKRQEAIRNIRGVLDSGAKTIKMYRSVPADVKEGQFRNGDWITPSRAYAEENARIHGWKESRIIEQEVSIEDIWWDGNDIAEWGFDDGKGSVYKNTLANRKLLEPTYDDAGNLIPLSKRFNDWKNDIRFAVGRGLDYGAIDLDVFVYDPGAKVKAMGEGETRPAGLAAAVEKREALRPWTKKQSPADLAKPIAFDAADMVMFWKAVSGAKVNPHVQKGERINGRRDAVGLNVGGDRIELVSRLFGVLDQGDIPKLHEECRADGFFRNEDPEWCAGRSKYAIEQERDRSQVEVDRRARELYERRVRSGEGGEHYSTQVLGHEIGHTLGMLPAGKNLGPVGNAARTLYDAMTGELKRQVGGTRQVGERAKTIKDEARRLIAWWHGQEEMPKYYEKDKEMFAEVFGIFLTQPESVQASAPTVYDACVKIIAGNERLAESYRRIAGLKWSGKSNDRVMAEVRKTWDREAQEQFRQLEKMSRESVSRKRDWFNYALNDRFGPMFAISQRGLKAERKALKAAVARGEMSEAEAADRLKAKEDEINALKTSLYNWQRQSGGQTRLMVAGFDEVRSAAERDGVSWSDVRDYAHNMRVIELGGRATAHGIDPARAAAILDEMKGKLGAAGYAKVEKTWKAFRAVYEREVLEDANVKELFDEATNKMLFENKHYVTMKHRMGVEEAAEWKAKIEEYRKGNRDAWDPCIDIQSRLHKGLGGGSGEERGFVLYHLEGSFEATEDPIAATIRRAIEIKESAARNHLVKQASETLRALGAKGVYDTALEGGAKPHTVNQQVYGKLTYMDGGVRHEVIVPKVVFKSFKGDSPSFGEFGKAMRFIRNTMTLWNPMFINRAYLMDRSSLETNLKGMHRAPIDVLSEALCIRGVGVPLYMVNNYLARFTPICNTWLGKLLWNENTANHYAHRAQKIARICYEGRFGERLEEARRLREIGENGRAQEIEENVAVAKEMLRKNIFQSAYQFDKLQAGFDETAIMQQFGYRIEGGANPATWRGRAWEKAKAAGRRWSRFEEEQEAVTKIIAYLYEMKKAERESGLRGAEAANHVDGDAVARTVIEQGGTPNLAARGVAATYLENATGFFWNVRKEGMLRTWRALKDHPTEWLTKNLVQTAIPAFLKGLMVTGGLEMLIRKLFDDDEEKIKRSWWAPAVIEHAQFTREAMKCVPGYYQRNYNVLPLAKFGDHVLSLRVKYSPEEFAIQNAIHTAMQKFGADPTDPDADWSTLAKGVYDEFLPNIFGSNYGLDWMGTIIGPLIGVNPYDSYRGRNIYDDATWKARWDAPGNMLQEMGKNFWNYSPFAPFVSTFKGQERGPDDGDVPAWIDRALTWPVISRIPASMLTITSSDSYTKALGRVDERRRAYARLVARDVLAECIKNGKLGGLAEGLKDVPQDLKAIAVRHVVNGWRQYHMDPKAKELKRMRAIKDPELKAKARKWIEDSMLDD